MFSRTHDFKLTLSHMFTYDIISFNSKIIEQDGIIISNRNRIRWNIIEGLYKKKGIKESRD